MFFLSCFSVLGVSKAGRQGPANGHPKSWAVPEVLGPTARGFPSHRPPGLSLGL